MFYSATACNGVFSPDKCNMSGVVRDFAHGFETETKKWGDERE